MKPENKYFAQISQWLSNIDKHFHQLNGAVDVKKLKKNRLRFHNY